MKLVGTSAAGNPMIELEPEDRASILAAGAFLSSLPVIDLKRPDAFDAGMKVAAALNATRPRVSAAGPASKPKPPAVKLPTKAAAAGPGRSPVRSHAVAVLMGAPEPMTPAQIALGIQARGYKFEGSSGAAACVGSLLRQCPDVFRQVGRAKTLGTPGLYELVRKTLPTKPPASGPALSREDRLELIRLRAQKLEDEASQDQD